MEIWPSPIQTLYPQGEWSDADAIQACAAPTQTAHRTARHDLSVHHAAEWHYPIAGSIARLNSFPCREKGRYAECSGMWYCFGNLIRQLGCPRLKGGSNSHDSRCLAQGRRPSRSTPPSCGLEGQGRPVTLRRTVPSALATHLSKPAHVPSERTFIRKHSLVRCVSDPDECSYHRVRISPKVR